jgi:hypothetical protein
MCGGGIGYLVLCVVLCSHSSIPFLAGISLSLVAAAAAATSATAAVTSRLFFSF